MWTKLGDQVHVSFYEEWNEDWSAMARAVRVLQEHPAAGSLFAFTSLYRFHLTTSPDSGGCDGHHSVSIIWRPEAQVFHLAWGALSDGWLADREPDEVCGEGDFEDAVEPFIKRVLEA